MKQEKGITLISITIYVIAMVIIIGVISVITGYFYKNVDIVSQTEEINSKYVKLNRYFAEETNKKSNSLIEVNTINKDTTNEQRYVTFAKGNQYTYIPENKSIYVNNVKICDNVDDCTFIQGTSNEKTTLTVSIKVNNETKSTTYSM